MVDELAHTNVPGSAHPKRWQDVHELLDAGIDVVTTVNVQHLESLNDDVEAITGVKQRETVPDHVVRDADQIQLVDLPPEALRRRLAHGNVYRAEQIDASLTQYFRVGNLTALRELALLWLADRVDDALRPTGATTASSRRGRRGSAWSSRSRAAPRGTRCCGAAPGSRSAPPGPSCSRCTCSPPTGCRARRPRGSPSSGSWSSRWAGRSTRSSARTSPTARRRLRARR